MKINLTSPSLSLKRRGTRQVIAIVGPTASGKTAVGIKLAKKFNGEIVSADSRQVFRGLDIGTAKEGVPTQKWMANIPNGEYTNNIKYLRKYLRYIDSIPQWLIDIAEPCTTKGYRAGDFNLFKYTKLARLAIEDIFNRGKTPIIVGGTGLYVQALVEGFRLEQNNELRIMNHGFYSRQQLEHIPVEKLQEILKEIDAEIFEKLSDKKNPHRLIRAIERVREEVTMAKEKPDFEVLQIGLEWPREILNQRIDKRVDDRFEQGMLGEVVNLIDSGVDSDWLLKLGLEYRIIGNFVISKSLPEVATSLQAGEFLNPNKISNSKIQSTREYQKMAEELKTKSHQYAKRQMTWWRRFPEIVWLINYRDIEKKVGKFLV